MKKSNNKGFMLLETLIVSTVILSTLIFLYVQFVNIKKNYEISFRYNTIPGLYMTKGVGEFLTENGYTSLKTNLSNNVNGYLDISSCSLVSGSTELCNKLYTSIKATKVLFVNDDLNILKTYLSTTTYEKAIFNEEFKRYILNLTTKSIGGRYRIIIQFSDNTFASMMLEEV